MSVMGRVHPAVIDVSKEVGRLGWRVSSIYRPTGTHALGISLDICPQVWTRDGPDENRFGLRTARLFFDLAKRLHPELTWYSQAEDDHIHLQLSRSRDMLGLQKHGHGPQVYDPITYQKVDMHMANLNDQVNFLPEHPIGDVLELGDSLESGDLDIGDASYGNFAENGGPRKVKATRLASKAAAKGAIPNKTLNAVANQNPAAAAKIVQDAKIKAATRTDWLEFEYSEGCTILNSALGLGSKLRPWEVSSIKAFLAQIPPLEPKVIPLTLALGVWSVQLDAILSSLFGLPDGFEFPYVGAKLMLSASDLNKTRGANITINRAFPSPYRSLSMNVELAHDTALSPAVTMINGNIVSGRARFSPTFIPVLAAGSANFTISIVDLPSTYTPSLRLFMPSDGQVEKLFHLL